MVKSIKYLIFLTVWIVTLVYIAPTFVLTFDFAVSLLFRLFIFVERIFPTSIRDFSFWILDFRIIELFPLLFTGMFIGILQAISLRILINSNNFLLRWIFATGLGTYFGRLITELYAKFRIINIYGFLDGGDTHPDQFEPYIALPVLSFIQGIVLFTYPRFYRSSGLIWWLSNSILSILQTNPVAKYLLAIQTNRIESFLFPSEGQILIGGMVMIGIFYFSPKKNTNDKVNNMLDRYYSYLSILRIKVHSMSQLRL